MNMKATHMSRAVVLSILATALALPVSVSANEFSRPWADPGTVLVLDPYAPNAMDFDKIATDKRVVGFIHQSSRGLTDTDAKYQSRRAEAKRRGYLWGSYHLLTTADARQQVDRYLSIVGNNFDETYAIDVECLSTDTTCQRAIYKVRADEVLTALRYFHERTGNFPLLYTNHSVRSRLAPLIAADPRLAAVRLWYARFRSNIGPFFPDRQWKTYTLWQFASEINCKPPMTCPYRVPGTRYDMDLNVYFGSEQQLRAAWPLHVQK